jgi:[ribosomal protein S5]-alanine N-acetyltransferase
MDNPYIYKDGLETKRLVTRFLTHADILPWTKFFNDPDALEFLPIFGFNSSEEKAAFWIDKQLTRYREKKFGLQALIDKSTNSFIGQCGLIKQVVDDVEEVEVGYHIYKQYWGLGYASEAAKLFIDYAFANQLSGSVISLIATGNLKSQRVAEKNGLAREKQTTWSGHDVFIYRLHSPV